MTGVLLAVPPADFVLHNSLFLVAHFHNVIIGGVVFGLFAGINYWFPKAFGFKLDAVLGQGRRSGAGSIGFWVAFMPLYVLGLMGVTRRLQPLRRSRRCRSGSSIAALGAVLIALGIGAFLMQIVVSFMKREQLRDTTGDPWDGRTLEWSTSSPPPPYNFAFTPVVHDLDAWWDMKQRGYERPRGGFRPIHMPKNTGAGVILAALSTRSRLRPDLVHLVARGRRLRRADRGRDRPHLQLQPRLLHPGRGGRRAPKTARTPRCWQAEP